MKKIYKTKNNLQKVWNELDKAYEHLERALYDLNSMSNLPKDLARDIERFDISEISCMKLNIEYL